MALIFTADVGQPIKIGPDITVTILRQKGAGEVVYAVDAPRELYIDRGTQESPAVESQQTATQ